MKTKEKITQVSRCDMGDCAYNRDRVCHARAITVGDGDQPACDTFFRYDSHIGGDQRAYVGACKVFDCIYNKELECTADTIAVEAVGVNAANCMMFEKQ